MISGVFERLEDFCLAMSNPQPNLISDGAPIYHHLRWAEAKLMLERSSTATLAGAAEKRISSPPNERIAPLSASSEWSESVSIGGRVILKPLWMPVRTE